ncbi:MAG: aminopeptidase P family protein [Halarsenatibacteraceae bacterium]
MDRINKLKNLRTEKELDAIMITSKKNRFYFSKFTGTAGTILITDSDNYFITDFRYIDQAKKQTEGFEIIEISKNKNKNLIKFLNDHNLKKIGFEDGDLSYKQYQELTNIDSDKEYSPLSDEINEFRMIKDDEEVETIKEAIKITEKALKKIITYIEPGMKEREVAAELEYYLRKLGGDGPSFDFIVASGKRSALPHGVASDKIIETGDFITLDFGTYYKGYCSDMTRTIVVGEPDEKQVEIYNIVLNAHLEVIDKIKPGMTGQKADQIAREIIEEAGYGDNFGHGLGHGLGIEVHEEPRLSTTSEEVLKPGMIVTDEPGIYLPDWGGVRIEDDLVITEDGCKSLNQSNKELIII